MNGMNVQSLNRISKDSLLYDIKVVNKLEEETVNSMINELKKIRGTSKLLEVVNINFNFKIPKVFTLEDVLMGLNGLDIPNIVISLTIPKLSNELTSANQNEFRNIKFLSLRLLDFPTRDFEYIIQSCSVLDSFKLMAMYILDEEGEPIESIFTQTLTDHQSLKSLDIFLGTPETEENVIRYLNSNSILSHLKLSSNAEDDPIPLISNGRISNNTLQYLNIENNIQYYKLWDGQSSLESLILKGKDFLEDKKSLVDSISYSHALTVKVLEFDLNQEYIDSLAEIIDHLKILEKLTIHTKVAIDTDFQKLILSISNHKKLESICWDSNLKKDGQKMKFIEEICKLDHPTLRSLSVSFSSSPLDFEKIVITSSIEILAIFDYQLSPNTDNVFKILKEKVNLKSIKHFSRHPFPTSLVNEYYQTHLNPLSPNQLKLSEIDSWEIYFQVQLEKLNK
ncbi:fatty acyl-CoA synthetase [Tieghemostelium lacteum]|uniref:Fatty acyl-CoA synthetase n=1 Tax=Tieghemostelium lacteum TaxID=361077 RepID=A0A151ZJ05_TIELA|nr:fatty acyl-CoA synthetase [Tieghemostelium lacteum]|eukprot:KYQ93953.1 fatty acyl-CoA synthetase [Tieghemostelium lacteum]